MPHHDYSREGSIVLPGQISSVVFQNIGRIVRAVAELEDVVTLYLCRLAKLSDGHSIVLFGNMPLSRKIQITRTFAQAKGEREAAICKEHLDSEPLRAVIEFRNTVAHGRFIGITDGDRLAFRTFRRLDVDPTSITIEVVSYRVEDFLNCAIAAEEAVGIFEESFRVKQARAERAPNYVNPHTKAPSKGIS
jgi:hypothetical protein